MATDDTTASTPDLAAFLFTRPADARQVRCTLAVITALLLATVTIVPFAQRALVRLTFFIAVYDAVAAVTSLTTAALLAGHFLLQRSVAVLWLLAAFVYAASMAVLHAATFPGLFAGYVLGAGDQTTAWLYFAWYGGTALLMLAYALWSRRAATPTESTASAARAAPDSVSGEALPIVLTIAAAAALAALCGAAATLGHDGLPALLQGDGDLPRKYWVAAVTLVLLAAPLPALLYWRRPSVLDLWLAVTLTCWLCQVALEAQFNAGRYSLGWYAGRLFGAAAGMLLLTELVLQNSRIQRRLATVLASEWRQRQLLIEGEQRLAQSRLAEVEARQQAVFARRRELEMRRLVKVRIEAREAERRRLARDLHDDLGQSLAAIKIRLETCAAEFAGLDSHIADRIEKVSRMLDAAQVSLRQIVVDLRPPLLDELGLVRSLEALVEDFEGAHQIACQLVVTPPNATLADPYATAVYRIVQESLTNVARHAQAKQVEVELRIGPESIGLRVHDDGQAFNPKAPPRPGAAGLVGMRERIEELGGRFGVDSAQGRGTTVSTTLPTAAAAG
jgi:two-component system sensor histidine kinase UhpB